MKKFDKARSEKEIAIWLKERNEGIRVCPTCGNPIRSHNNAEKYFKGEKKT